MRGTISILTLVSFVFSNLSPAVALADVVCKAPQALSAPAAKNADPRQTQLDFVIGELKSRNLDGLLAGYSQFKIQFVPPASHLRAVDARVKRGKGVLVIRNLDFASPEQRELAIWNVAESLYRLELATSLRRVGKRPVGAAAWRDARLNQISLLQGELYKLLSTLQILKLNSRKILEPTDPAQNLSTRILSTWSDPVKYIAVNQADWELYETPGLGMSAVNQKNKARYSALLVRVYRIRRILRAAAAAGFVITLATGTWVGHGIYQMMHPPPEAAMITDQEFEQIETQIAEGRASSADIDAFLKRLKIVKDQAENKIFGNDRDNVSTIDRLEDHDLKIERLLRDRISTQP